MRIGNELVSRTLAYGLPRILPAFASVLAVALFVRAMGESAYSALAVSYAAANAISALCSAWLAQAMLRYFPGRPQRERNAYRAFKIGTLASMGLAATAVPGLLLLIAHSVSNVPTAFMAAMLSAIMVWQTVLLARVMLHGSTKAYLVSEITRSTLLILLAYTGYRFNWLTPTTSLAVYAASYLGSILALLSISKNTTAIADNKSIPLPPATRQWLARMARFGYPLSIWMGVMVAQPLVDRALLLHIAGTSEAGRYAAVYDIYFRVASFLFAPVLMTLHPTIMRDANTGQFATALRRIKAAVVIAVAAGPIVGISLALCAPLTAALLGLRIKPGDELLAFLLALGGWLWQCGLLTQKVLEIRRQTMTLAACMLIAVSLQALLVTVLAAEYGALGAAAATGMAAAFYSTTVWIKGSRTVGKFREITA